MRDFTRAGGRLHALPVVARLVYTVFLAFTLVAIALTAWLADEMVGLDLGKLGAYYAGEPDERTGPPEPPMPGGPALELPDESPVIVAEAMPRRKLLEVTHFHLFSMPVYLLILAHLFMLSGVRDGWKVGWIIAGSVATALHAAAPWIATSGSGAAAVLYGGSGLLLAASYLVMSVVPLWEMWVPSRPAAKPE